MIADRTSPRATRWRVISIVLAVTVAVLAAACEKPPIMAANRPTTLTGQQNGELDAPMLVAITDSCKMARTAAPALGELLAAARTAGVALRPTSCYRDLAGQVAARDYWCGLDRCENAAVPGTSNHGWGKAVDFGGAVGTTFEFTSPAYAWLKYYAWVYGFNHPGWAEPDGSAPEPWHWEWVGDGGTLYPGVTVGPQAP